MDDRFELTERGAQLELFDRQLSQWVARFERMEELPERDLPFSDQTGLAFVRSVAEQFPIAHQWVQSTKHVRVMFSAESQRALADHSFRLMQATKGQLPVGCGRVSGA